MKLILFIFLSLAATSGAWAEVRTRAVEYSQEGAVLEGFLAYDDAFTGKRPGVLVAHEWTGLNNYIKHRSILLAQKGYIVFALDIYGKGIHPIDAGQAAELSSFYKNDRPLLRARAAAGLSVLRSQPNVDPSRLAAIGYCFGGTTALELARSGADIKGVVSFHGGLATPTPQDAKNIKAELLVLHGMNDPFVPEKEVAAFEQEMKNGNVRYQLVSYPGAVHGFTNPVNKGETKGALYNADADRKSWRAMHVFLVSVMNRDIN